MFLLCEILKSLIILTGFSNNTSLFFVNRRPNSISNGYTDDVRKELSDLNKTLMLIAQILRNK